MSDLSVATQALCRQCSAPLPVEPGSTIVTCSFCGTANALDKSQTVFRYVVRETIRPDEVRAILRRWMAGNATVKDLDRKAQIESASSQLFPMWLVRARQGGEEKVLLEPAAALSVSALKQLKLPAADLEPFAPGPGEAVVPATVPYKAMLQWLAHDYGLKPSDIREAALLYLPVTLFKYLFRGRRYTAVVDAAAGEVFCNIFPSKPETPYRAMGVAAFVVYFLLALVPGIGYLSQGAAGMGGGILVYLILSLIVAIPLLAVAAAISARV